MITARALAMAFEAENAACVAAEMATGITHGKFPPCPEAERWYKARDILEAMKARWAAQGGTDEELGHALLALTP